MKKKNHDKSEEAAEAEVYKSIVRENLEALFVAVLLALFIRSFVVQAFKIPSGSMIPTLQIGDHILVNKFSYGIKIPFFMKSVIEFSGPEKGDIVVFKFPNDPDKDFIKRVIGTQGDVVEMRNKHLLVNGKPVENDHGKYYEGKNYSPKRDDFGPMIVPEDSLFVLGDNRDSSHDSRFWGFVNTKTVKGKAFLIYWSWNSEVSGLTLKKVRWSRLFDLLE